MNAKTLEAVRKHGESLLAAFPNSTEKDPVALCKKLRRIETSLVKPLTDYCNGTFEDNEEGDKMDYVCANAKNKVFNLLKPDNEAANAIFINRDPRGCALKLCEEWTKEHNGALSRKGAKGFVGYLKHKIYTDMGGYGILAPDLNT